MCVYVQRLSQSFMCADEPRVPGEADLRNATEPEQPLHGIGHPDAAQLRVESARRVPAAQALQDRAQRRDTVPDGRIMYLSAEIVKQFATCIVN